MYVDMDLDQSFDLRGKRNETYPPEVPSLLRHSNRRPSRRQAAAPSHTLRELMFAEEQVKMEATRVPFMCKQVLRVVRCLLVIRPEHIPTDGARERRRSAARCPAAMSEGGCELVAPNVGCFVLALCPVPCFSDAQAGASAVSWRRQQAQAAAGAAGGGDAAPS
jgi:hypothetical protein